MFGKPVDPFKKKFIYLILLLISGVNGCNPINSYQNQENQQVRPDRTTASPASFILTPSPPKPTPIPTSIQPTQNSQVLPDPTITPQYMTHQVIEGDTLLGIALQYGVDVDDIINVNPGIDPNILSIGITISIPLNGSDETRIYVLTPIPITLHQPQCFPSIPSGLTCLLLAENTQPHPVEHVTAQIIVQFQDGSQLIEEAYSPIDLILPGKAIPLIAHLSISGNEPYSISRKLSSALPMPPGDTRYIDVINRIDVIEVAPNKLSATIHGEISNTRDSLPAQRLWLLVIAYDQSGNPIGYRKWVYNNLTQNEILSFDITVYSLGPEIDRIEILAEAKQ
jgi:LysM repeat protein